MQAALQLSCQVQAGGIIHLSSKELLEGQAVDVIVLLPTSRAPKRRSIASVLASAPGHLGFENAAEVDAYIAQERAAWER